MSHHQRQDIQGKNLLISTILNLFITIAEVIGGLLSNSLALLSDALHNFSDGLAVFLAYIANRVGKREHNTKKTFGYKRIEILAALFNAVVLIVISVYLLFAAYERFLDPQPVKTLIMFTVAIIGLAANIIAVVLLKKDAKRNLNVRAAYIHLLGDTFSSILVIAGGIIMYFFKIYWLDPLITVLIVIYIVREAYKIVRETVQILMQSTPAHLNLQKVKQTLETFPEIDNIHHVHAWNLTDQQTHFECHVDLNEDIKVSETCKINSHITSLLKHKFQIDHVTLQFEYGFCTDKKMIMNKQ